MAPAFLVLTHPTVQRFVDLGVHRLIMIPPRGMEALDLEQWVKTIGETLGARYRF